VVAVSADGGPRRFYAGGGGAAFGIATIFAYAAAYRRGVGRGLAFTTHGMTRSGAQGLVMVYMVRLLPASDPLIVRESIPAPSPDLPRPTGHRRSKVVPRTDNRKGLPYVPLHCNGPVAASAR